MMKNILNKIIWKTLGGSIKIGGFNVMIDRNQSLPFILEKYPDYGANIVRLARVVFGKYQTKKIIDVGGNIGDTIAMLLGDNPQYEIFSVEGDEKFYKILKKNFGAHKSVHLLKTFLGEKNEVIYSSVTRDGGTLKINSRGSVSKNAIEVITLDSLLEENNEAVSSRLIKIDTDGYDNKILRGAKKYLSETKPVIYFEYDSKFLKENGEIGVDIFEYLESLDYETVLFFDNYGRFLISVGTKDKEIIKQLDRYTDGRVGAFAYYDIVAFHRNDSDIAESFIKTEERNI